MTFKELWELTSDPFIHVGDHIKVTLVNGAEKTGYYAELEYEFDNDVADGLRFEKRKNEDTWGNGIVIPATDIQNVELLPD
ncbi:MAG: hypothetical protein LBS41_00630 [Streptococcaceae bacterium]|jgi:hypothetical protein|nr:hypothetical protein [Streptococcaceae bacterium]